MRSYYKLSEHRLAMAGKQEQVYLYMGKHSEVEHLYVVDRNEENRNAIGYLCQDLYPGVNLLDDIQSLEAALQLTEP